MKTSSALLLTTTMAIGAFLVGRQFPSAQPEDSSRRELRQNRVPAAHAAREVVGGRADPSGADDPGSTRQQRARQHPESPAEALKEFLTELNALAEQDPVRALDLALVKGTKEGEHGAIVAIRKLVLTKPGLAADYAVRIAATPMGLDALEHVANDWAKADPAAAEKWARTYQGPARDGVLLRVLTEAVRAPGPAQQQILLRAADELPALLAVDGEGDYAFAAQRATDSITEQMLATQPPQTTLEWSLKLPQGAHLARAQQTALDAWIREDAPAATAWIGRLPAGAPRDQLVARLVQHLRQDDPEAARLWADSIGDEKLRSRSP